MQSKNKINIKNTKSILEKENEISNIRSNDDYLFKNGNSYKPNSYNNYDFLNLNKNNKNTFGAKIDLEKKDLYLGKINYVSPFDEKSKFSFKFFYIYFLLIKRVKLYII